MSSTEVAASMQGALPEQRRLRILCLHGFRQNATRFKVSVRLYVLACSTLPGASGNAS
jgi:hypothetical protein